MPIPVNDSCTIRPNWRHRRLLLVDGPALPVEDDTRAESNVKNEKKLKFDEREEGVSHEN